MQAAQRNMSPEAGDIPLDTTDSAGFPYSRSSSTSYLPPKPSHNPHAHTTTFEWSRRIAFTTEPLWIARIRRHKFRTFILIFIPSVLIFLLAFFLAPARPHSKNNGLKFKMRGDVWTPNMSITAGVIPKRFHSHQDYKQYYPLLSALSYGAASVEADVFEQDGQLLLGDDDKKLSTDKNLTYTYLDKLEKMIDDANKVKVGDAVCGVFGSAPYLPFQLLVRIHSDGESGYDLLQEMIQPLYKAGYLTTHDTSNSTSGMNWGALTIIVTGNVPVSSVITGDPNDHIRYIFFDAPLKELDDPNVNYTITLSPIAAASWSSTIGARWLVPSLARNKIQYYVEQAHSRGIQARFWETPSFPSWVRNHIWDMLLDEGADWLDVDDLCDAGLF